MMELHPHAMFIWFYCIQQQLYSELHTFHDTATAETEDTNTTHRTLYDVPLSLKDSYLLILLQFNLFHHHMQKNRFNGDYA